jgi:hypothetical protein
VLVANVAQLDTRHLYTRTTDPPLTPIYSPIYPRAPHFALRFVTFASEASATECANLKHTVAEQTVEVKKAVPREAITEVRGAPKMRYKSCTCHSAVNCRKRVSSWDKDLSVYDQWTLFSLRTWLTF